MDDSTAVDGAEMDVSMMEDVPDMPADEMEAAAPSVALSGSAKMGLKRVDDNTSKDPDSDNIQTVVEYEVTFSSSGVTDGGLLFGAAISIDEEGKGADGKNGVNEASAFIGGADGSWKLQFGDNDPGIDLVGNIGLADADAISGKTLMLETANYTYTTGSGTTAKTHTKPLKLPTTMANALTVPLTSVKYLGNGWYSVNIEDYFSAAPTATDANEVANVESGKSISLIKQKTGGVTYTAMPDSTTATTLAVASKGTNMPATTPGRTAIALTGTIASVSYALTSGESGDDAWSLGAKYDAGAISVGLGMDSNDVMALSVGGTFAGNSISGTYVRQSGEDAMGLGIDATTATAPKIYAAMASVNKWTAMGLKFSRDIGSGSNIALAYSKKDDKNGGPMPMDSNRIDVDFTYALGGGAKFYAEIERLSEDMYTVGTDSAFSITKGTKKTTTIGAGVSMSF